jgi:diguanylate cyclase (GGDEF)-like protein
VAQLGTLAYFLGVHAGLGWTAASRNVVFEQTFTLLWTCVLCNFSVYVHERRQRAAFNARRNLEVANAKLHKLNQQLQETNLELHSLAFTDRLTQLANRRCFDKYLDQEWRRMARENAPLSLILSDVDFFKIYNDTYGHQAGDSCLQQVAKAIRNAVKRPADLVARYGGEEFVVILPNTSAEGAVHVAEKIRAAVKALKIAHANSQIGKYVTLSLGVASTVPCHKSWPANLIATTDQALYQAKAQGRDRVILYK